MSSEISVLRSRSRSLYALGLWLVLSSAGDLAADAPTNKAPQETKKMMPEAERTKLNPRPKWYPNVFNLGAPKSELPEEHVTA